MSTNSPNKCILEEWKETRAVLARFDENQHDLRKYGFIFLAALLAANSFQAYLDLPELARCVLLVITIAFIVALRLLDDNYQKFKKVTAIRSRVLEVSLNIKLSETIDEHYKNERWDKYISLLYYAFIVITILLGIALLFPVDSSFDQTTILSFIFYLSWVLIAAVVGVWFIRRVSSELPLYYGTQTDDYYKNDWMIDRVTCVQGENVKISITNLHPEEKTVFSANEMAFTIIDEEERRIHTERAKKEITLENFENYSWLWNTSKVEPDKIYRVLPRARNAPLKRSIVVHKKDTQP